ncbi:MAG: LytR/AlgR family response regulator transcription factor [Longibaculum sp.]
MEIAIVDDQREYHNIIRSRLELIEDIDITVHSFTSVTAMENSKRIFDLILLDVDMPDINGVEYSKNNLNQNIVFISNYGKYMKKAYGPNVYGFIEKSDSLEYFVTVIKDVINRIISQKSINIKTDFGVKTIFEKDIIYLQYVDRKTIIIKTVKSDYTVKGYSLKQLFENLNGNFVMCDRDLLINVTYIMGITNENIITLKNIKNKFKISTRRIAEVRKLYYSKYR